MALTRGFIDTVRMRAQQDVAFRRAMLKEALDVLLEGEVAVGRSMLRDYINATIGFEELASEIGIPAKSLHRMFGANGNPSITNLISVITALRQAEHVTFEVLVEQAS
ncbi:MAG: transcriptional regulator [Pseudomonadota bacterium]